MIAPYLNTNLSWWLSPLICFGSSFCFHLISMPDNLALFISNTAYYLLCSVYPWWSTFPAASVVTGSNHQHEIYVYVLQIHQHLACHSFHLEIKYHIFYFYTKYNKNIFKMIISLFNLTKLEVFLIYLLVCVSSFSTVILWTWRLTGTNSSSLSPFLLLGLKLLPVKGSKNNIIWLLPGFTVNSTLAKIL